MIEIFTGNVLDEPTGIIVHGCNCQGVMGAGIALQVKERFPEAYKVYRDMHEGSGLVLGEVTVAEIDQTKFIVNANTQNSTGNGRQVSYDAIATCFETVVLLADYIRDTRGENLAVMFPMIGAGLGGGNWEIISTIIDKTVPDRITKVLFQFPRKADINHSTY